MFIDGVFHVFDCEIHVTAYSGSNVTVCVRVKIKFAGMLCGHFVKVISNSLPVRAACGGLKQDEPKGGAGALGDSLTPYLFFSLCIILNLPSISPPFSFFPLSTNTAFFKRVSHLQVYLV